VVIDLASVAVRRSATHPALLELVERNGEIFTLHGGKTPSPGDPRQFPVVACYLGKRPALPQHRGRRRVIALNRRQVGRRTECSGSEQTGLREVSERPVQPVPAFAEEAERDPVVEQRNDDVDDVPGAVGLGE
jgi:hypothetical protein